MVEVRTGDIFQSQAQTLVNTVNCVGVMGKGLALQFKQKFPDMFKDYALRCSRGEVRLGRPYLYRSLVPPMILNFPTKDHWRSVARLDSIVQGLAYLSEHYKEWGITSLAVPPLGCGQGQLEWRVVGPTLYRWLEKLDIPVELYAPAGTPASELEASFLGAEVPKEWHGVNPPAKLAPASVALVEILREIEEEPYHWPVGRIMFQKIVFAATREGLPTGLEFRQGSYGPFSEGLKHVVTQLINNGLLSEERLGRMFEVRVGPTFGDAQRAYAGKLDEWQGITRRVADLFVRLDTSQAEVVASVLFAADELARRMNEAPSEDDVVQYVMRWKQKRVPPFDEGDVADSVRHLGMLGWLRLRTGSMIGVSDYVEV